MKNKARKRNPVLSFVAGWLLTRALLLKLLL